MCSCKPNKWCSDCYWSGGKMTDSNHKRFVESLRPTTVRFDRKDGQIFVTRAQIKLGWLSLIDTMIEVVWPTP